MNPLQTLLAVMSIAIAFAVGCGALLGGAYALESLIQQSGPPRHPQPSDARQRTAPLTGIS